MLGKLETETNSSCEQELLVILIIITSIFPILISLFCGLNITIKIKERINE